MTAASPTPPTPPAAGARHPPALQVEAWRRHPRLVHGFFGRIGGVSRPPWSSLNLSRRAGDEPGHVEENWARVRAALGPIALVGMEQVHGTRVVAIHAADQQAGEADGLVTDQPGCALAVLTADCVPILLVSPRRRLAMALHAGWRGTVAGIVAHGLAAAERSFGAGAAEWEAALGPSIGGCCYEVGAEIGAALEERWGAMPFAWRPQGRRGRLDLRKANRAILAACGVPEERIFDLGACTACATEQYFSHRKEAGRTGRQLGVVGWR
jgi:hypothetical protein